MNKEYKYSLRGVSSNKEEVHQAIKNLDKGLMANAFCKVLPDILGQDPDYINVMHADTAGTKTSLAYLYWKETGDLSVWKGVAQDAIVMNIDDMACVGITDDIIISSTIGRNKNLITGAVIAEVITGTNTFLDQLRRHDVNVTLAGGETADVGDIVRTIDIGITAVSRWPRAKTKNIDIKDGDVIVGLASYGQATYEQDYNSGIGSNGLTSARHDLLHNRYADKYTESFDPKMPANLSYCGSYDLKSSVKVEGKEITFGKLLLSPTRSYLPVLKQVLSQYFDKISGIIHCTGGGQVKVKKFAGSNRIVKDNLFAPPIIFQLIKEESKASYEEMYNVFNMGHRMEIYCRPEIANDIISISRSFNIDAQIIGHAESNSIAEVVIHDPDNQQIIY